MAHDPPVQIQIGPETKLGYYAGTRKGGVTVADDRSYKRSELPPVPERWDYFEFANTKGEVYFVARKLAPGEKSLKEKVEQSKRDAEEAARKRAEQIAEEERQKKEIKGFDAGNENSIDAVRRKIAGLSRGWGQIFGGSASVSVLGKSKEIGSVGEVSTKAEGEAVGKLPVRLDENGNVVAMKAGPATVSKDKVIVSKNVPVLPGVTITGRAAVDLEAGAGTGTGKIVGAVIDNVGTKAIPKPVD